MTYYHSILLPYLAQPCSHISSWINKCNSNTAVAIVQPKLVCISISILAINQSDQIRYIYFGRGQITYFNY